MKARIGFMQGRLCDKVDGRIQAFPWRDWELEFPAAQQLGLGLMEWTIDQERLAENPLMTVAGRARIMDLCQRHCLAIPSLTGDCFMQAPFWKASGVECESLKRDFFELVKASAALGITMIVVPLVDNGRLENPEQENVLVDFLLSHQADFAARVLKVIFEVDLGPAEAARFLQRLPAAQFGLNYDIGNSAALGYKPEEEFAAYGARIVNVHVKDRRRGGTTVPLGNGDANFDTVFGLLKAAGYSGNYIMQTARADDNDHAAALEKYRTMVADWISGHVHAA